MSKSQQIKALEDQIAAVETRLYKAQQEAKAWNSGRTKKHLNADLSNKLASSYDKQLRELEQQLSALKKS